MNGSNPYWQYQPPRQPPGGVYYPQPPRERSTVRLWWFLGAPFAVTIATVVVILVSMGNSGPSAPPAPPRDQASYQDGYNVRSGQVLSIRFGIEHARWHRPYPRRGERGHGGVTRSCPQG